MVRASTPPAISASAPAVEIAAASTLLEWRRRMLALPGIGSSGGPELDWLLDLAGGVGWPELQALWRRHRATAEPLQYLVGVCPWRDLELQVGPGVLIPRQESELLVEVALSLAPVPPAAGLLTWADLGTGSGALALALARAFPTSRGLAVETCPRALRQAAANLEAPVAPDAPSSCGGAMAPVELLPGSWWEPLRPWWGGLHLVVSNPPYIPTALLAGLDPEVRDHEPTLALDGGADGLDAIRAILCGAPTALAPGGVLLLEHHHDQSEAVLSLMAAAGLVEGRSHPDLEGVLRFASAWREIRP